VKEKCRRQGSRLSAIHAVGPAASGGVVLLALAVAGVSQATGKLMVGGVLVLASSVAVLAGCGWARRPS
jgi:ABC-type cobalamin transport system ATPase subunit